MVNDPQHYGISSRSGLPPMQGNLAYDTYVEQARTRAAAEKSLVFQQIQTALLGSMAGTLSSISSEMDQIRGLHQEALAVQQELLRREAMQQHLEEMIFQADKLVAQCADPRTDMPPSSRFFLLQGFLKTVEQQGIGTPIIKGRDNKAAFERVVQQAADQVQRLSKDPEVQQAVAWAKKLEDQRRRKRKQIEQELASLRSKLESLRQRKNPVTLGQVASRWMDKVKEAVPPKQRVLVLVLGLLGAFCLLPFTVVAVTFALPVGLIAMAVERNRLNRKDNEKLYEKIGRVEE